MVVGLDGAFIKAAPCRLGQRHQIEILTGRTETSGRGGEAFAVVRHLDPLAKQRVQAILCRSGRGRETNLTILSDGEDGLRSLVGTWFGKKCRHRLDWFHVARRIERIRKGLLYLLYDDDFRERIAAHHANVNSMKWMLWNDGVEIAEFGMTQVRVGLFQHAQACPERSRQRFREIEAKLTSFAPIFTPTARRPRDTQPRIGAESAFQPHTSSRRSINSSTGACARRSKWPGAGEERTAFFMSKRRPSTGNSNDTPEINQENWPLPHDPQIFNGLARLPPLGLALHYRPCWSVLVLREGQFGWCGIGVIE